MRLTSLPAHRRPFPRLITLARFALAVAVGLTVSATSAHAQTVDQFFIPTNDIVYDPGTARIYASIPSSNSIINIDPVTGIIGNSVYVGSEPNKLALSDNGQYLYVGLDGADAVRRFDMATQTATLQFGIGSGSVGPYRVGDMQVLPGEPTAVAVARNYYSVSPYNNGVAIYDNGILRPNIVSSGYDAASVNFNHYGSLAFSNSPSLLYAFDDDEFTRLDVNSNGVSLQSTVVGFCAGYGLAITYQQGRLYSTNGKVADPVAGTLLGRLPWGPLNYGYQSCAVLPDAANNRVYLLMSPYEASSPIIIAEYDSTTFLPIGSLSIPNSQSYPDTVEQFGSLIKWGTNGLAFRTNQDRVYIIHGSALPGLTTLAVSQTMLKAGESTTGTVTLSQPAPPGGITVSLTSTSYQFVTPTSVIVPAGMTTATFPVSVSATASSSNVTFTATYGVQTATTALTVLDAASDPPLPANMRVVNLVANDLVYDPFSARLYASVPSSAGAIGNSITTIDPVAATVGTSIEIGSEPDALAVSDDGQYLYVGLDGAAAVRRLPLATLTPSLQFILGSSSFEGPPFPGKLVVLPNSPHSLAVSLQHPGFSPSHAGVAVYDDGIPRRLETNGGMGGVPLTGGADATRLYGYDNESTGFEFQRMAVSPSGVSVLDNTPNLISGFGVDIKYDAGRVYSSSGEVIDPEAKTLLGTFNSGGVTFLPDSADGKVYFIALSSSGATLESFDPNTFLPLGSFALPSVTSAGSLVRWGPNQLAFRANGNQIFLVNAAPPQVASLSFQPASVSGGQSTNLTVTLSNVAMIGGMTVHVTSSDPDVQIGDGSGSVSIAQGSSQATVTMTTPIVLSSTPVTITASGGGATVSQILTLAPTVGVVRYAPRVGWEPRMVGGQFQGSNDDITWTTLDTVTSTPPAGQYTIAALSADPAGFRYLRYLAPDGAYGNIAELEFYSSGAKLTGTGFGTAGSWSNDGNVFGNALDGDLSTFFDAPAPGNGDFVGIDRGTGGTTPVGMVRYAPRPGWEQRMVGGQFQGSNDDITWTTLATVTQTPPAGQWSSLPLPDPTAYRFLRYLAPDGAYGNIAEVEFDSNGVKLTGTGFGTAGSWSNDGNVFGNALDGDLSTFFDAPAPGNGDFVGIDRGAGTGGTPPVTGTIRYAPRVGWEQRMVGGQFQGSSDGTSWTTLYTVASAPAAGQWTSVTVPVDLTQYRYLRYLAPDGAYGNVAEIEFDGASGKLTGTGFGTAGSWSGNGNVFSNALDGNLSTFFDAPAPGNGDFVGIQQY